MNAFSQAQRAYSAAAAPTRTPRGIEYDAVARVTRQLQQARKSGDFPALVQALQDNKSLWNIFAVDIAKRENPLPDSLKAQLFYLAQFTHQHTSKILARQGDIDPLLDINTAILAGLRGETT